MNKDYKEIIYKIKAYADFLMNQSFEGWTDEEIRGYKTALYSVLCKIKELMDR